MKTIEDVMALVSQGRMASYLEGLNAGMKEYGKSRDHKDVVNSLGKEIEAALRELVERKPLSAIQKNRIFMDAFKVMVDGGTNSDFSNALIDSVERAHSIGV